MGCAEEAEQSSESSHHPRGTARSHSLTPCSISNPTRFRGAQTGLDGKTSLPLVGVISVVMCVGVISTIEPKQNFLWGEPLISMVEKRHMTVLKAYVHAADWSNTAPQAF